MEIITPKDYVGTLMELCQARRGDFVDMQFLTETRTTIIYELPLATVYHLCRRTYFSTHVSALQCSRTAGAQKHATCYLPH